MTGNEGKKKMYDLQQEEFQSDYSHRKEKDKMLPLGGRKLLVVG